MEEGVQKDSWNKSDLILISVVLLLTLLVAWKAFDSYYFDKNYIFSVEAPCDITSELCYVRDCEADYCPPNGLSEYKIYNLRASDFAKCEDNSCSTECASGAIECTEVSCGEYEEDQCSTIPESEPINTSTSSPETTTGEFY